MSNARNIANLPNGDDAPVYACRAWVNFEGNFSWSGTTEYSPTANPTPIRDAGNISSIREEGTADYVITFSEPMPHTNYVVSGAARYGDNSNAGAMRVVSITSVSTLANTMKTDSIRVSTQYQNGAVEEIQVVTVAIFC